MYMFFWSYRICLIWHLNEILCLKWFRMWHAGSLCVIAHIIYHIILSGVPPSDWPSIMGLGGSLPWSRNHTQITCVVRGVAGNSSIKANTLSISPDMCRNGKESMKNTLRGKNWEFLSNVKLMDEWGLLAETQLKMLLKCVLLQLQCILSFLLCPFSTVCLRACVCMCGAVSLEPKNCHIKFNRLGGTPAQSDLFWPISSVNLIGGPLKHL